jgi:hypothetical protein
VSKSKPRPKSRRVVRTNRTDRARETFLAVFRDTCNVSEAARAAGVGRRTVYDWRDADPAFAAAWDEAEEEAVDALEAAARKRAMESSDRLMEILLKAHRPAKYMDRSKTEITGKAGADLIPARTDEESRNMLADRLAEAFARLGAGQPVSAKTQ